MRSFWLVGLAVIGVTSPLAAQVDFRGLPLGTTLEEFKTRATPAGFRGGPTRVICTDTDRSQSWLTPPTDLIQAGVIACGYVEEIGRSTVRAGVPLSPLNKEATVEFRFHGGRLYFIETYMDFSASPFIEEALTAKYGAPTTTRNEEFQTRSGAVFPQMVKTWKRGQQTATLTAPDLTTERMSVIYSDETVSNEVERLAKAARNPSAIM